MCYLNLHYLLYTTNGITCSAILIKEVVIFLNETDLLVR